MNTHARILLAVAVGAQILAGCERSPTGPSTSAGGTSNLLATTAATVALNGFSAGSERSVSEVLYDLTDVYFVFGCNEQGELLEPGEGELVRMEGSVFERITLLRDAAGGYHVTEHTMPVGLRGIGVISGEEFRVTEREHRAGSRTMRGLTGSYRQELKLIGRDTRRTFWIVWSGHYTITADEQIIVQRDHERAQCRL